MIKKFVFYTLSILIFFSIFLIFDLILSNTILKNNHCINYSEYFYELKKNCSGKYRFKKSFPLVETFTDKNGLRVGKNNTKKDKNKKNIFIFGDSFTYGVGIEHEKTFAGKIANNLNEYNVYNFAVGSYSPTVHLYRLKKAIHNGLVPNKILIFLDLTDVLDEAERWYYDANEKRAKLRSNNIYKIANKKKNFKDKNFKLSKNFFSYINYNLRNFKAIAKLKTSNQYKIKLSIQGNFTYTELNKLDSRFWHLNTFDKGINNIKKNFNELKDISKKHNFDIYLIVYPWAETLEFGQAEFNWSKFAKDLCSDGNCNTIDAIPEFLNYKQDNKNWVTDLYFLNDEHFNIKGANLLYNIVINYLKNENSR